MDVLSDKRITKLVATQGKTRVYEMEDGEWLTAKEGTISWRNNNPGNLKFAYAGSSDHVDKNVIRTKEQALSSAQRGYDGVVALDQFGSAVFESYDAGRAAQRKLVAETHKHDTVETLIRAYSTKDYSGDTHYDAQAAVIYRTAESKGLDLHGKQIIEMTPDEKEVLLDGLSIAEEWTPGVKQTSAPLTEDELKDALKASTPASKQHANPASHGDAHVHRQGDKGESVGRLQSDLASLGLTARDGSPIRADQDFGSRTKEAVEAFQQSHGLHVDGVAGKDTLAAIEAAKTHAQAEAQQKAPSLLDAHHSANGMYEQAYQCVARIDAEQGRQPGPHTQAFAGSLTAAATAAGFNRVDHVVLNDDASRGWAVQGDLNSPFKQYTEVNVMQAIQTPIAQSSQEAAQNMQNNAQQQSQQQQMQQQQQETMQQQGPMMGLGR